MNVVMFLNMRWQHSLSITSDAYNMDRCSTKPRVSKLWSYFTKKDQTMATCNQCNKDYSYKTSVSNLGKHLMYKHGGLAFSDFSNAETSDDEASSLKSKGKSTWKYFEILDSDKFVATCKICDKEIPYDSVSDLTKHITDHGEVTKESAADDDDDEVQEVEEYVKEKKAVRRSSKAWKYFKDIDPEAKLAVCLICKKIFSYNATVSNLVRHLQRKHGLLLSSDDLDEDSKRIIISANGDIYEVDTSQHKIEMDEGEKDPMEVDTIYLNDIDESNDPLPNRSPEKHVTRTEVKKTNNFTARKRIFKKTMNKEQLRNRNRYYSSSEDEVPVKKRKISNSMDRIDCFGQYVTSLLRELPKHASDQLQSDIIKRIISTKLSLEAQPPNYAITIEGNRVNVSNQISTSEPVIISESETIPAPEINSNDIVVESTENNDTVTQ